MCHRLRRKGSRGGKSQRKHGARRHSNLNEFQALALDGSTITQDDFSDKDITVINFLAPSCGLCLAEMPDLAALEKALPDNIQLMTFCLDGSGNEEYVTATVRNAFGAESAGKCVTRGRYLTVLRRKDVRPVNAASLFAAMGGGRGNSLNSSYIVFGLRKYRKAIYQQYN